MHSRKIILGRPSGALRACPTMHNNVSASFLRDVRSRRSSFPCLRLCLDNARWIAKIRLANRSLKRLFIPNRLERLSATVALASLVPFSQQCRPSAYCRDRQRTLSSPPSDNSRKRQCAGANIPVSSPNCFTHAQANGPTSGAGPIRILYFYGCFP